MPFNSTKPNISEDDIAIMSGKIRAFKALPDGVVRMMVEIDPPYREMALHSFSETGASLALARLNKDPLALDDELSSKK